MGFYKRVALIAWALTLMCIPAGAEVMDKIVAVVNDEVITLAELDAAFEPYRKNIEETYKGDDKEAVIKQTKEAFLKRFIDNILIEQEAKKAGGGIIIKDEEVMEVLQDLLARQKSSMEDLLKKLSREGSSLESVKKDIKSQLMRTRLLRREVKSKIVVSDEEIGEYYDKHRQDYEGKEAVRIKQILLLIPPKADKAKREKLKNEAQKLRQRIINGESFDILAFKYSQGPAAAQGGDVGFIGKGAIIPELEAVVFSLPIEQLSEIIESNVGFHIIKVVDKRGAGLKPITAVRVEIKEKIENEKLDKKFDEWIASVRAKSHIDIRL